MLSLSLYAALLPLQSLLASAAVLQQPLHTQEVENQALYALNNTLQGRIQGLRPVARSCYSIDEFSPFVQNATLCQSIMTNKQDDEFMIDHPGAYYSSNWAACQRTGEACAIPLKYSGSFGNYVAPSAKCHQGNVPDYYIDINNTADIQAVFKYAPNLGLPIVIKNTGHDIKGRSAAPGALALWTHNLRHPKVPIQLKRNFIPESCEEPSPSENVFTFGAGETWGGLYTFAEKHDLAVIGGTCGTVGIAGWLHGAAHSPLSTHFGLGADNIRQVRIVLPTGKEIVANDCQHEDIFKAVKGGGGGTYGVVTEMSYKALPKFHVQEFTLSLWGLDMDGIRKFFDVFTLHANDLADKGWGGYINSARGNRSVTLVNPRATQKEAAEDVRALIDYARDLDVKATMMTHSSWYDYYQAYYAGSKKLGGSWGSNDASRLVPRDVFANNETRVQLVETMMDLHYARLNFIIMPVTPVAFTDKRPSSLHPSWRTSPWLVRINDQWDPFYEFGTPGTVARSFENVHRAMDRIRQLIPNVGVSINEADIWEPDHAEAFWGEDNFRQLQAVKRKVDPKNILQTIQGVGADHDDPRFRCYPLRREAVKGQDAFFAGEL